MAIIGRPPATETFAFLAAPRYPQPFLDGCAGAGVDRMMRRVALLAWLIAPLLAVLPASLATAQTGMSGYDMAKAMVERVVRVTGRQTPGIAGQTGYGLIVGQEANASGETVLVVIVPYTVVRDPERPGTVFQPPALAFSDAPLRLVAATLLPEQLPPERGNLSVLHVAKPATFKAGAAMMADPGSVLPGVPVWQVGNTTDFPPATAAARLAYQDQVGWLLFEGIDNAPVAIGAAVVGEHGLVGLAMGPSPADPIVTRVLPLPFISVRTRAWGHNWDIPLESNAGARGITVGPTRYNNPRQADGMALAPINLIPLLAAEASARSSWTPEGAMVSPWYDRATRLFASPRREATVVGVIPAGRYLPEERWRDGAYTVLGKLDGGAWFQVATSGQPLGYVNGSDVVEIWPLLQTAGLGGGKVVREWNGAGGRNALLRDTGTAFELETTAQCNLPRCLSAILYTPAPPQTGAIVPAFQVAPLRGVWHKGDLVSLRALLPRRVIETEGTRLYACLGGEIACTEELIYPPPAR